MKSLGYLLYFVIVLVMLLSSVGMAANKPAVSQTDWMFSIEGQNCGRLGEFSGGGMLLDVLESNAVNSDGYRMKTPGALKRSDINPQFFFGFTDSLAKWIADFNATSKTRRNCQLTLVDDHKSALLQMLYSDCTITGLTIPTCDAASKEAGLLELTLSPLQISEVEAPKPVTSSFSGKMQKNWIVSNFALEIDGKDCSDVIKIESFTIGKQLVKQSIGSEKYETSGSGANEFIIPKLKVTIRNTSDRFWRDWFDDFAVKGNHGTDKLKTGHLYLLPYNNKTSSADRSNPLAVLTLNKVGICGYERLVSVLGKNKETTIQVELYCESMQFSCDGAVISAGNQTTTSSQPDSTATQTDDALAANGECEIGTLYKMGIKTTINIVVNSLDYSVGRIKVAGRYLRPSLGEKLLAVHYSVTNPGKSNILVGQSGIDWLAVDSNNISGKKIAACVEQTGDSLNQNSLLPGKTLDCVVYFRMPIKGVANKLTMSPYAEKLDAFYNLDGKVNHIPAPYCDVDDPTGSTPQMNVVGKKGTVYMVGDYDINVISVEKTDKQVDDLTLEAGKVYALVTIELKAFTLGAYSFSGSNIALKDANNQAYSKLGILSTTALHRIALKPEPGETIRCRMLYRVPKNADLTNVLMKEDTGRAIGVRF
jgi:hypothetical protein